MPDFKSTHWALLDLVTSYLDEGFRIVATTDVPCHLYCRMSRQPPHKHVVPSPRRGTYWTGEIRFCFVVFEDNEQVEPGDTLVHTWLKYDWQHCQTRWFYFVGTQGGLTSVSETAYFHLHYIDPLPNVTLYPAGPGLETNIPREYPNDSIHWQACQVEDMVFVYSRLDYAWSRDLYALDPPPINSFNRLRLNGIGANYGAGALRRFRYALYLPGFAVWESVNFAMPILAFGSWADAPEVVLDLNPFTGMPWDAGVLPSLQVGIALYNTTAFGYPAWTKSYIVLEGVR
ncbi:hypothetical protein ES703_117484 [subsurface metagenome]